MDRLVFRREGEGALRFVTLYRDRIDYAPRATRSPEFLDQGHSERAQTRADRRLCECVVCAGADLDTL